jgi:hypothetical protein
MTMNKSVSAWLLLAIAACGGAAPAANSAPIAPVPSTTTAPGADTSMASVASATAPAPAASVAPAGPDWAVAGTWAEACSCNIPCPCLSGKVPSLGHCDETMIFHVDKGHYGPTTLDGLDVVIIGQSTHGKTFDQSIADKDMPLVNTYLPKDTTDAVASAADAIFTRLSFSMPTAGKKHAIKKLGIKATWAPEAVDIEIPGVLTAHMKAQKDAKGKPKTFDAFAPTGVFGPGTQGVSLSVDFHDDGVSWTFKERHSAWTPFSWDSSKGPLPWEKAPGK